MVAELFTNFPGFNEETHTQFNTELQQQIRNVSNSNLWFKHNAEKSLFNCS